MQLYEAQGELMAVTTVKPKLKLPSGATYDDYLARPQVPNVEASVPLNLTSGFNTSTADDVARSACANPLDSSADTNELLGAAGNGKASLKRSNSQRKSSRGVAKAATEAPATTSVLVDEGTAAATLKLRTKGSGRKMKARLWLAQNLPINQRQLLPLLDIISTQNKFIGKVRVAVQSTCRHCVGYLHALC